MGFPAKKLVKLLAEHDPASMEFREGVREALQPPAQTRPIRTPELDLWKDVFVQQKLPWVRFLQSAVLHVLAIDLVIALSIAWVRQQKILAPSPFDRSSVITYSPEEYLPPLDTGPTEVPKPQVGDPVFAKQPILSVPREADNRFQTVVVPPDLKLNHDVPLPNIVATGAVAPIVPLNAVSFRSARSKGLDPQVIAPSPDLDLSRNRATQAALKSEIVPPPPELKRDRERGLAGPDSGVVEPPPELTSSPKGRAGSISIGPSAAVAPAPQLPLAEQHVLYARGQGGGKDFSAASAQPVAPPPTLLGAAGGAGASGRLIALNVRPTAPTGPVAVPAGNRRGSFEAGPQGRAGAAGTPNITASKSSGNGTGFKGRSRSLPAGLHVGDPSGPTAEIARDGASGGDSNGREGTSASSGAAVPGRRSAAALANDKVTDADRQVFGDRRLYGTALNMPNLNSSTGSWVMHFAELQPDQKQGDLMQPLPTEKSDPGYPLELIRENVHGTVTLYAVIHADGGVDGIRVLNTPDDRLNSWAISALAGWKFLPALREGKPVAVEAVVEIPFRVRKAF